MFSYHVRLSIAHLRKHSNVFLLCDNVFEEGKSVSLCLVLPVLPRPLLLPLRRSPVLLCFLTASSVREKGPLLRMLELAFPHANS